MMLNRPQEIVANQLAELGKLLLAQGVINETGQYEQVAKEFTKKLTDAERNSFNSLLQIEESLREIDDYLARRLSAAKAERATDSTAFDKRPIDSNALDNWQKALHKVSTNLKSVRTHNGHALKVLKKDTLFMEQRFSLFLVFGSYKNLLEALNEEQQANPRLTVSAQTDQHSEYVPQPQEPASFDVSDARSGASELQKENPGPAPSAAPNVTTRGPESHSVQELAQNDQLPPDGPAQQDTIPKAIKTKTTEQAIGFLIMELKSELQRLGIVFIPQRNTLPKTTLTKQNPNFLDSIETVLKSKFELIGDFSKEFTSGFLNRLGELSSDQQRNQLKNVLKFIGLFFRDSSKTKSKIKAEEEAEAKKGQEQQPDNVSGIVITKASEKPKDYESAIYSSELLDLALIISNLEELQRLLKPAKKQKITSITVTETDFELGVTSKWSWEDTKVVGKALGYFFLGLILATILVGVLVATHGILGIVGAAVAGSMGLSLSAASIPAIAIGGAVVVGGGAGLAYGGVRLAMALTDDSTPDAAAATSPAPLQSSSSSSASTSDQSNSSSPASVPKQISSSGELKTEDPQNTLTDLQSPICPPIAIMPGSSDEYLNGALSLRGDMDFSSVIPHPAETPRDSTVSITSPGTTFARESIREVNAASRDTDTDPTQTHSP